MISFTQMEFESFFNRFVSANNLMVDYRRLSKKFGSSRAQHRMMLIFAGCGVAHRGQNLNLVFKNSSDDIAFKLKYSDLFQS